ncbi:MAG: hypothetical protein ACKON9_12615 [Planctomycetaceae bacterium]
MRRGCAALLCLLVCVSSGCGAPQAPPEFAGIAETLDQQARQGVTPENNAAARLSEVVELYADGFSVSLRERLEFHRRAGVPAAGPETPRLRNFSAYERDFRELDRLLQAIDVRFNVPELFPRFFDQNLPTSGAPTNVDSFPWTAEQHPAVAAWLRSQEPVLEVIRDAAGRSHWYLPVIASKGSGGVSPELYRSPSQGDLLDVFTILRTAAMLRLGEEQVQAAWTELRTLLRLSRLLQSAPDAVFTTGLMMEGLATDQCQALLSLPGLSESDIDGFLRDLQALPAPGDPLLHADRYGRPVMLELLEYLRRDEKFRLKFLTDSFLGNRDGDRGLEQILREQPDIDWDAVARRVNEEYDRGQQLFQSGDMPRAMQSIRQAADRWEKLLGQAKASLETGKSGSRETVTEYVTLSLLVKGPLWIDVLEFLALAAKIRQSLLQTSCWLRKYQLRTGDWPENLVAVEQLFGCRLPPDPVVGRPLNYRRSGAVVRLYSVGENGIDDGGVRESDDRFFLLPFSTARPPLLPRGQ